MNHGHRSQRSASGARVRRAKEKRCCLCKKSPIVSDYNEPLRYLNIHVMFGGAKMLCESNPTQWLVVEKLDSNCVKLSAGSTINILPSILFILRRYLFASPPAGGLYVLRRPPVHSGRAAHDHRCHHSRGALLPLRETPSHPHTRHVTETK